MIAKYISLMVNQLFFMLDKSGSPDFCYIKNLLSVSK